MLVLDLGGAFKQLGSRDADFLPDKACKVVEVVSPVV